MCTLVAANPQLELIGTATNGLEAVENVRRSRPDLVIMDVQMPVMNGIEAAKQLQREFPDVLTILVSVHDIAELRDISSGCGACAFICKDRMAEALRGIVEAVLSANVS